MSTGTYDYTRHDNPSDADSADDYEIADVAMGHKSADQLEDENTFQQVPPGERTLYVVGFVGPPKEDHAKVFLDGRLMGYVAATIGVEFAEVGQNPRARIRDYFTLPPADPSELKAYYEGKTKEDQKQGGFAASKFLHFIDRLGFPYPPGGHLPPAARVLKNWKGRIVKAVVEEGQPWTDKEGKEKKGYNRIKMFSYRHAQSKGNSVGSSASPSTSATQAARVGGQVGAAVDNGLNAI